MEKLCQRFRLTEDPRQWRDIAFCLSLLPFKSERSVKKLIEGLPNYRDKLHEEVVYQRFTEILQKVVCLLYLNPLSLLTPLVQARTNKSTNKPDTELDEFEKVFKCFRSFSQLSNRKGFRYWRNTNYKGKRIRLWRSALRVRKQPPRRGRPGRSVGFPLFPSLE